MPGRDPAKQQQGALAIEAGGARFEAVLQALARQTENPRQLRLAPALAQQQQGLLHQLVPQRRVGSWSQRVPAVPGPSRLDGTASSVAGRARSRVK